MVTTVLRRLCAGLLLLTVAVVAWTAFVLVGVRGELTAARSELEAAREDPDPESALPALERAEARLQRAVDRLGQPGPVVAAAVPLIGRSVRAVDVVAEAALAVTSSSREVLAAADGLALPAGGSLDLDGLSALGDTLGRAGTATAPAVDDLLEQPDGLLPGAVADPLREAQIELAGAPAAFTRGSDAVQALSGLLGADGSRRLLVVLENNAELRGTGGLVSVFAEATAVDGAVTVEAFRDIEEVADEPPDVVQVDAPADYRDLWGRYLADSTLWVNTNMSPDVPTSSQVLSSVAVASGLPAPDAVLWLDVVTIASVLEATGPVQLPDGREVTGENAVDVLLSRAYVDAPDTPEGQAQRREALRAVADAVLARLLGGQAPSLAALGAPLADAASGRHLALWSADPAEQDLLVDAGLAGQVAAGDGDLASMTIQNLGGGDTEGNKLDYYAERSLRVRALVSGDRAEVVQVGRLDNGAPPTGLPRYVAGGVAPGTTNNLVTFAVPRNAEQVVLRRGGRAIDSAPQPEGDHAVVLDLVSLPPGTGVEWELSYVLPIEDGDYRLTAVPQPLHAPADLQVEVVAASGVELRTSPAGPLTSGPDGVLVLDEEFVRVRDLPVATGRSGWAQRAADAVRRFWREPVELP